MCMCMYMPIAQDIVSSLTGTPPTYESIRDYLYVYIYMCTYVYVYLCMYTYICVCIYVYVLTAGSL